MNIQLSSGTLSSMELRERGIDESCSHFLISLPVSFVLLGMSPPSLFTPIFFFVCIGFSVTLPNMALGGLNK